MEDQEPKIRSAVNKARLISRAMSPSAGSRPGEDRIFSAAEADGVGELADEIAEALAEVSAAMMERGAP